jgi:hypothetical protein
MGDWTGAVVSNVIEVIVNPPVPYASPTVANLQATGTGIKWYAGSSGGPELSPGTLLVDGQHYYASQTVNGLESQSRTDVVAAVDPTTCPPTGSASQTFSAGSTVANLVATGLAGATIRWYAASSGGTALSPATLLTNATDYYAAQTKNCIESATRLKVTVTVN